jgi:hypothetical protein
VEVRSGNDSIFVVATETDIDGIDADVNGGVESDELADAQDPATLGIDPEDTGIFVSAFGFIPADWKVLIEEWLGGDGDVSTEEDTQAGTDDAPAGVFTIAIVNAGFVFSDANGDGVVDHHDVTITDFVDSASPAGADEDDLAVTAFDPATGEVTVTDTDGGELLEDADTITFEWEESPTIAALQAAIVAQDDPFDELDTDDPDGPSAGDDSAALDDLLAAQTSNLGEVAGTSAATTLANRLLGVEDGDDVDVRYTDQDPSAIRAASAEADLVAPTAAFQNPTDDSFTTDPTFDGEFTVTDEGSGTVEDADEPDNDLGRRLLDVLLETQQPDGTVISAETDVTNADVDEEDELDEGSSYSYVVEIDVDADADAQEDLDENLVVILTLRARDAVGNQTIVEVTFTVDVIDPDLFGALTGWSVAFDSEDEVWDLVENDDEWVVLIFDAPIDGDSLSENDLTIPGHTVQDFVWIDDPEGLRVHEADDYDGANATDDITDDGGAGMDLTLGVNPTPATDGDADDVPALNDARHLVFVQVEEGSIDTGEAPDVEIGEGDLTDLAGNSNPNDLEIEARDRLWPGFTVAVTTALSNNMLDATITATEDLDDDPTVLLWVDLNDDGDVDGGETEDISNDVDSTSDSLVWAINADLDDLGLDDGGADDAVFVLLVEGVDLADNAGSDDNETWELDTTANDGDDPASTPAADGEVEIDEPVFLSLVFGAEGDEYAVGRGDDSADEISITTATLETLTEEDGDVVGTPVVLDPATIQTSDGVTHVIALNGAAQGFFNLVVEFQDEAGNEGEFELPFAIVAQAPVEIDVVPGWTLFSVPNRPQDRALDTVLEGTSISQVWSLNNQTMVWEFARLNSESGMWEGTLTQITDGRAYYAYSRTFDPIEVLTQRFSPQQTPPVYPVRRGWNGIGVTLPNGDNAVLVTDYLQTLSSGAGDPGWGVIRHWDATARRWESAWPNGTETAGFPTDGGGNAILEAGNGYLLFATRDGNIAG